jgi:hypothetical protein
MFMVDLKRSQDDRYRPLTVSPPEYLYSLAQMIHRSLPDCEVHASLGYDKGDEVVFRPATCDEDGDIELF